MRTIRAKLSALFVVVVIILVLIGILLNVCLLKPYYIYKKKAVFQAHSARIIELYEHDRHQLKAFIDAIDQSEGISSLILDSSGVVTYTSVQQQPGLMDLTLPKEIRDILQANALSLAKQPLYTVATNEKDLTQKLVYIAQLHDQGLVILRWGLDGVTESVAIANQFYLLAGLVLVTIGGFLIYAAARKATQPVIQMSHIAEEISNLVFDRRVHYQSSDELGGLGASINRMSEKLSENMTALQQDVNRRKQLVRNISHELKTPIAVIKGYVEGLQYGVVDEPEKVAKYYSVIEEECNRMDGMVRELLQLSAMEFGLFELNPTSFELVPLIRKAVERFAPELSRQGIQLDLELNIDASELIRADYELIERVIINYLSNAIHYTNEQKSIQLTATKTPDSVILSVFNTGQPIAEEDLSNIWDVFYKADRARSRAYGGHGLGLSIVKLIAELHGGQARVQNVAGGVRFDIEWPN
ncbi:HAMP domain-containing histidine kinase [Paenibacillus athensensis]|uniref:histidine kinase n=1 Tax=Paenibacillus athensensis TaxID=1967502 RepID=A0A4Y8PYP8_9BACL|nr:HAMP domain-containing sensor histidine kinase [Paenibacillus athensensis]MCD1261251.1 HAMP domain-containing histidine kinase [Paenibacillus athensensis]